MRRLIGTALGAVVLIPLLAGCAGRPTERADDVIKALEKTRGLSFTFSYTDKHEDTATKITGTVADDLRYSIDETVNSQSVLEEVDRDDTRALRVGDSSLLTPPKKTGLASVPYDVPFAEDRFTGIATKVVEEEADYYSKKFGIPRSQLTAPSGAQGNPIAALASGGAPGSQPNLGNSGAKTVPGCPIPTPNPDPKVAAQTTPAPCPDPAVVTQLSSGGWVSDSTAAHAFAPTISAEAHPQVGQDQVRDALSVFTYAEQAIRDNHRYVTIWDKNSLDYRPDLDFFPAPANDITRYDVMAPPSLDPRATGGSHPPSRQDKISALPPLTYFRFMAIYVNAEGIVTSIQEKVDVGVRFQDQNDILARVGDLNGYLAPSIQGASKEAQAAYTESIVNSVLYSQQKDTIRERTMDFELSHIGDSLTVTLPDEAAKGNLTGILDRGQIPNDGGV